jgi:hypothetical protein
VYAYFLKKNNYCLKTQTLHDEILLIWEGFIRLMMKVFYWLLFAHNITNINALLSNNNDYRLLKYAGSLQKKTMCKMIFLHIIQA